MSDARQKVYKFMSLPYHVIRERAVNLGVFEDGDDAMRGDEILLKWVRQAKAKGCAEELLTGAASPPVAGTTAKEK